MRRIILVLLFFACSVFYAIADEIRDVGISKYAVLEVLSNRAPVRSENNEDAYRMSHLFKDTVIFADKQTDEYYRIELSDNKFAWINKKLVELQAIIPEKRFDTISKIAFKEDKASRKIDIETPFKSAYLFEEKGNNLDFTLFDNRFDPIETKILNKSESFTLSQKLEDNLEIKFLNDAPLFGYDIIPSDKGYILNIKKAPKINRKKPLKNIKVVLDAGHGGSELGCCAFDLKEKDINLQIVKQLRKELRKKGAKVYLTRKKDKKVPLYDRVDFAKEKNADILLSIHQNSLPNPKEVDKKHGSGTYYYHNQSKPLAQAIQDNLLAATNFQDDKVNFASFALTRPTSQISVLVECGYLIYKDEADKLKDKTFQKIVAKAIAKGCEDYLRETF